MKLFGIEWGAQRAAAPDAGREESNRIDPGAAGRALAELACLAPRERVKARARMMRTEMGLPPLPPLEPRCGSASCDDVADAGNKDG